MYLFDITFYYKLCKKGKWNVNMRFLWLVNNKYIDLTYLKNLKSLVDIYQDILTVIEWRNSCRMKGVYLICFILLFYNVSEPFSTDYYFDPVFYFCRGNICIEVSYYKILWLLFVK